MKRFNLSVPEEYKDKDGNAQTKWNLVGEMVEFDSGNRIVKIPAIGLTAQVFEQKKKEDKELDQIPF